MDIKLIALDLDGTTLQNDHTISPRVRKALESAMEQGIAIVPCTGRMKGGIPQPVRQINGVRYCICSNGASVVDLEKDCFLYQNLIPLALAKQVLQKIMHYSASIDVYIDGVAYNTHACLQNMAMFEKDPFRLEYVLRSRRAVDSLEELLNQTQRDIEKFNISFADIGERTRAWEELSRLQGVSITTSIDNGIEINRDTTSKADALQHLCEYLHIPQAQAMAVGDGHNDRQMLAWAGCSVAMGNASDETKAFAKHVTTTNEQDGVALAIETYALK